MFFNTNGIEDTNLDLDDDRKKVPVWVWAVIVVLLIVILCVIFSLFGKGNSEKNVYTVTYEANIFSADFTRRSYVDVLLDSSDDLSGELSYDHETSYLTIDGRPKSLRTMGYNVRTFNSGDRYKVTLTYVSGSISKNGDCAFVTEVYDSEYNQLSTRNYLSIEFPTEESNTAILTINEFAASNGAVLENHIYLSSVNAVTFDDYVVKVEITKIEDISVKTGSKYVLPIEPPSRTGYTFDGWYTEPSGGIKITNDSVMDISEDQNLYAQWSPKTLSISFDANGGNGSMSDIQYVFAENGDIAIPNNNIMRDGFTFSGWRIYNPGNDWWFGCTNSEKCTGMSNSTIGWHDESDITTYYTVRPGNGFNASHSGEDFIFVTQWK